MIDVVQIEFCGDQGWRIQVTTSKAEQPAVQSTTVWYFDTPDDFAKLVHLAKLNKWRVQS